MNRFLRFVVALLATCYGCEAAAPDATLTLSLKDGRSQFRMGEQIDVELRFESKSPGRYRLFGTGVDRRFVRQRAHDSYTAAPTEGVADPLGDSGVLLSGGIGPVFHQPLTAPVIVPGIVNDWISFRRPGTYRITAESERLFVHGQRPERVLLRSNTVELEILSPDPEWQKKELAKAVAILESNADQQAAHGAARTLRYLETRAAIPSLVRFYTSSLPDIHEELRAGLVASPHRSEVIAKMEEAIRTPDIPIGAMFLGALSQIEYARRYGAREPMPVDDPEAMKRWNEADRRYMERFQPIHEQHRAKLAEALPLKRGEARAVALDTLLSDASQPVAPQIRKLVVDEFPQLPSAIQAGLLMRWMEIAGPDIAPALRTVASRPGPARDIALQRLMEVDPAAARALIIERIRRSDLGDPRGPEPRILLTLPDDRLPELDDALIAALDHGSVGSSLVARYASDAALPRVLEWLGREPQRFCYTALSAYVFRADPARAKQLLANARESGTCSLNIPQSLVWSLMSPALEQAAIENLNAADPMTRRAAQTLLEHGGSAAAKQPLFDAFAALRERPLNGAEAMLENGFVDALIKGSGWVLTSDELDQVERNCITDACRQFAKSERRWLNTPVQITILPHESWHVLVGGSLTFTPEQTGDKLKQFPRGTSFRLPAGGRMKDSFAWRRRLDGLTKLIADAGMTTQ